MSAIPDPIRSALLQSILERSATDPDFRRRLLERPNETIRSAFGVRVVDNYRVRFIEKPRELDALVVLPDLRVGGELSERELEEVVGGTGGDVTWDDDPPPPPPPPPPPGP